MDESKTGRLWAAEPPDRLDEARALADAKHRLLRRGAALHLDRYRLGPRLGSGGGGTVYRAHDPRLRRDVAIKVVVAPAGEPTRVDECRRLAREAHVLGQLSHPNLVPIFDVGWLPPPRLGVFVVMELVDGGDLLRWLEAPRSWREVVDRFVAAAEGLIAAHDRGIVHRDFKPANVLCAADGRVLVADFGLARRSGPSDTAPIRSSSGGPERESDGVTSRGFVVGTPRYMPPEQHEGAAIDIRADVYAWCAAVFEALCGTPPFRGETTHALLAAKRSGAMERPQRRDLPAQLLGVLQRGLAADPDARWPNMRTLVSAVRGACDRRRGRGRVLGVAVVLGTAIGWSAWARPHDCADRGLAVAERWSAGPQVQVHEAFAATRAPFAEASFAAGRDALAGYVGALQDATVAACRARDDARLSCLSAADGAVQEVVSAWGDADASVVERARDTVGALPSVTCEDATAERPGELDAVIARVRARHALGRVDEGLRLADAALGQGDVQASPRAVAELHVWRGQLLAEAGRLDAALEEARRGYFSAVDVDATAVAAQAANALVEIEGVRLGRTEAGLAWGRHALALAARSGDDGWRGMVLDNVGELHALIGDHRRALELHEDARARLRAAHGPESVSVAIASNRVGNAHRDLGELDAAAAAYAEAHAIFALDGEDHPRAAMVRSNLGNVELDRGHPAQARAHFEAALEHLRRAVGPRHRSVGVAENGLANALWDAGDHEAAVAHYSEARAVLERALGPGHPDTAAIRYNLANRLAELGRHDAARREFREAATAFEAVSRSSPGLFAALVAWGMMERDAGDVAAAYDLLTRGVAIGRVAPRAPAILGDAEAILAEVASGRGRAAEAHSSRP